MNSGEYLSAYEIALSGIEETSEDSVAEAENEKNRLKYLAVLALARMGATSQAKSAYEEFRLREVAGVDAAALEARIEKDIAISAPESEKANHFNASAVHYEEVFQAYGENDYYPAINAASMYFLAGDQDRSIKLAKQVLQLIPEPANDYWSQASAAEAHLLIGDTQQCIALLERAVQHPDANLANTASTRRQFKLLSDDPAVLIPLALPTVVHFAGHIISPPGKEGRFPADKEQAVKERIIQKLDELEVAIAYGSLAAGADIMIAEQVLARGGELHVVLPFDEDEFIEISVAGSGPQWVQRFKDCLAQAASCTFSSRGPYNGNDALFHHCSVYAMGRACLRKQHLDAPITQLLVWNGATTSGAAGTFSDKRIWQQLGYSSHTIPIEPHATAGESIQTHDTTAQGQASLIDPSLKAILFGDVAGFSKLTDAQIPIFVKNVLGRLAVALEQALVGNEKALLSINTWGDGIFVVLNDVLTAAKCALAMQDAMHGLEIVDLTSGNDAQQPQLRVGAHFGPIFEFEDPMTKRPNYFGQHVNTAARIEPIAPQGEVYVTEAFAAHLALDQQGQFQADYVGEMELAKKFGKARMYLLRELSD